MNLTYLLNVVLCRCKEQQPNGNRERKFHSGSVSFSHRRSLQSQQLNNAQPSQITKGGTRGILYPNWDITIEWGCKNIPDMLSLGVVYPWTRQDRTHLGGVYPLGRAVVSPFWDTAIGNKCARN